MTSSAIGSLREGVVGGLLAGLVVVVWFLASDMLAGEPLRTPLVLGEAMLPGAPVTGAVAAYTLLHFGVFIALGAVLAVVIAALRVSPGFLFAVVVGLGLLTGVHYGALLATGASALALLPGTQVLVANLLAGMALTLWLRRGLDISDPVGIAALAEHPFAFRGVVTGLIGAGAVALWFLVLDTAAARPFFTPAALGSALFLGARSPDEVRLGLGVVAAYTVLHVAAFAIVGLVIVASVEWVERSPAFWLVAALGAFLLGGAFLVVAAMFGEWVIGALSWWAVGFGNVLAVATMAAWVWRTHPLLRRRLARVPADTRV